MIDKMKTYLSPNRFIPNDYEEMTALELIGKQNNKIDEIVEKTNQSSLKLSDLEKNKLSKDENFTGSWHGISHPVFTNEGLNGVVAKMLTDVVIISSDMSISHINNLLAVGGTFIFKNGEYRLTHETPIIVKSNSTITFEEGANLIQTSLNQTNYDMLLIESVENVKIYNPSLFGERDLHIGDEGEWGYGITIYSSKNVTIYNAYVEKTWGDGIYIGMPYFREGVFKCENINIINPIIKDCSRNGISICSTTLVNIENPIISGIDRIAPKSAIDIEPENSVEGNVFLGEVNINNLKASNCPTGILMFLNEGVGSINANINLGDLVFKNCNSGVVCDFITSKSIYNVNIKSINCYDNLYHALAINNKQKNSNFTVGDITLHDRRITNTDDSGEYSSVLWIRGNGDRECGNIKIHSLEVKTTAFKKYGRALKIDGSVIYDDVEITNLIYPSVNSFHNPFDIGKTTNFKNNVCECIRNQTYEGEWDIQPSSFNRHFRYNNISQQVPIIFQSQAPDGVYIFEGEQITPHSINVKTNELTLLTEGINASNKTLQGVSNGSRLKLEKRGDKLFVIEKIGIWNIN